MKTALVHDWLITEGGAEKVLEAIAGIVDGPIYTLFHDAKKLPENFLQGREIRTSFLQKYLFAAKNHRYFFPFFPRAVEKLDLSFADVIISSSHAFAKGISKKPEQLHICYCHTPVRYAWDLKESYLETVSFPLKTTASFLLEKIRKWDEQKTAGVDVFAANSVHVAKRIYENYQRKATVIYPPVQVDKFRISEKKQDYYVTHSRLVPYKRVDILVEAFARMEDKKLVVIGDGPEMGKLKRLAKKNIEFIGFANEKMLALLLSFAKAYVFAAEEDFGIGVVEAQASGLPVIAFKKGGVLETVTEGKTGLFFERQEVNSCIEAIQLFEKKQHLFDSTLIRDGVMKFTPERFEREFFRLVEKEKKEFYENRDFSGRRRSQAVAAFSQNTP